MQRQSLGKLSKFGIVLPLFTVLLAFQNCGEYSSVPMQLQASSDFASSGAPAADSGPGTGGSPSTGAASPGSRFNPSQGTGEKDSLACSLPHGDGLKVGQSGKTICKATKCDVGYTLKNGACEFKPVRRACPVENGTGEQVDTGKGFGPCQIQSCDQGYSVENGKCKFAEVSRSCDIPHGVGTQVNKGSGWSGCKLSSCDNGFHVSQGKCESSSRNCPVDHGKGVERYVNGQWGSCVADQCHQGYEKWSGLCVKKSAPTARVNLFILRNNNGGGNDKWTPEFAADVIKELTLLTEGNVKFVLNRKKDIANSADYNSTQDDVGPRYLHLKRFGEIGVLIPKACGGDAIGVKHNLEPFFVMNACHYPSHLAMVRDGARNILHELGHNMGMKHDYGNTVNMDSHYFLQPEILVEYIRAMNACTTAACQSQNGK